MLKRIENINLFTTTAKKRIQTFKNHTKFLKHLTKCRKCLYFHRDEEFKRHLAIVRYYKQCPLADI